MNEENNISPIKKKKLPKLTLKQAKFTKEYLKSGNGTQAAIKAGYSENSAQQIATENLSKPLIQAHVQSAAEKLGISAEYVLGNFKEMVEFGKKKTVKAKQVGQEVFHEEEMNDGQLAFRANESLGKHLAIFTEKLEVTGKDGKDLFSLEERKKNLAKRLATFFTEQSKK